MLKIDTHVFVNAVTETNELVSRIDYIGVNLLIP